MALFQIPGHWRSAQYSINDIVTSIIRIPVARLVKPRAGNARVIGFIPRE